MEPLGIAGFVIAVLAAAVIAVAYIGRQDFERAERYKAILDDSVRALGLSGDGLEVFFDSLPGRIRIDEAALILERERANRTSESNASWRDRVAELVKRVDELSKNCDRLNGCVAARDSRIAELNDVRESQESEIKELQVEVDRLKTEIASNLAAKRPKPWKQFLSNLISPSEANQS